MTKLSVLDTAFLALETEASPKHVAGLAVLDPGSRKLDLRELLAAMKSVPAAPPFNQKIDWSIISLPSWIEDPDMDIDWHVRHVALPEPGGMADLMDFVGHAHSTLLDRSRPLWEFYLIEGLEDGNFAIYFKMHHAYMDGATISRRIVETLNESPSDETVTPIWATKVEKPRVTEEERGLLTQLTDGLKSAGIMAKGVSKLGSLVVEHSLKSLGVRDDGLPVPFTAPRSHINERMSPARGAGTARIPLERVKVAAREAGVTVNDVLLSIVDGALMAYLDRVGEEPEKPLIAQMPISLRRNGESGEGNLISVALVELATGERDPIARLERIHRHAAAVKEEYGRMSQWTATTYFVTMQSIAQLNELTQVDRFVHPLGNILVSNLIGEPTARYLAGAKAVGMYPISTIGPGLSANITLYTCDGVVNVGLIAGREAIGDPMYVTESMVRSFEELEDALGIGPPARKKKKAKKTNKAKKKRGKKKSGKKKAKRKNGNKR